MMELTPLDVRKKKEDFRRSVRGYDAAQVDGFLDLVADRLEDLVNRELRLREQSDLLKEQLAAFQEREKALNEALVTAQELREEARAQAEKSADLRVREAERQAREILRDAEGAVQGARRGLEELKVRRAGFLRSLRGTIEHFLAEIADEERRGFAALDPDSNPHNAEVQPDSAVDSESPPGHESNGAPNGEEEHLPEESVTDHGPESHFGG
jgi:DivIVA domain-containing protein